MASSNSSILSWRGGEGAPGTVSAAVREHLRQLCLSEFPCGTGSWNKSRFLPKTWHTWRELVPTEEEAVSPEEETVETLLGLVRSPQSPWAHGAQLGYSSVEDRFLREMAIHSPLKLKDTFFYSYFRSLRVVDKQISLVDKDLLKFLKLEELILSANEINEVDASNLPPTLKVLELYGNSISSMACLCTHPPPRLQHLGLGHNKLLGPMESLFVTSKHWPNLISLDLGFNDLTDLQSMVASLSTLRNLRLLVLQGNPLALVPYYRGLTVDSLARLCVLDDIIVSPNEKHQFRGLSRSADLLAREAQFVVTIGSVRGVVDSSILDPEPGPEGPFITYNYYVTYDFVEDEEGEEKAYDGVLAQVWPGYPRSGLGLGCIVKPSPSPEPQEEESLEQSSEEASKEEEIPRKPIREVEKKASKEVSKVASREVPVTSTQPVDLIPDEAADESVESGATEMVPSESSGLTVHSAPLPQSTESAEELAKLRPRIDPRLCPSPGTVLFSTVPKPWADIIPCGYEMQHTLRDLVHVKAFLLAGTTVTIVEEKILSWPLVSPGDSPVPAKKGKGEDGKKKDKDKKGKVEEAPQEKAPKKKKEQPKELRQDPPILKVLGHGMLVLEPLLMGEPLVSTVCNFGVVRSLEIDRLIFARDSKKTKKPKAGNKEKTKAAAPSYEAMYRPQPLTVEVQIQLSQYRTAEEAFRTLAD
ncbi:leucine-rich repeat-containing protein 43 [Perognathus longimembris pacificus]|uniref:leucine-rich repeat-containing protein 43 n=1 Tax=Perognathus longimembris pacificus TaxID=214514 RepID=UPI0020184F46|nr:leucine-rich repeat-containing protein 43 [Perognathus longimembris pacificus]